MKPQIKRVYESPEKSDGKRILVDRLWPRGLKKEDAAVDVWLKEIAPSTELRRWYHGGNGSWEEFRKRYLRELDHNPEAVEQLREELRGKATLLYGVKDTEHNHARILVEYLGEKPTHT